MTFLFEYQSIRDFHPTMLDSRRVDVVFCHFAVSRQVTLNHPYKAPVPALLAKHSCKSRLRRLPSRVWLRYVEIITVTPQRIETLSNVSKKASSNQQKKIEKLLLKDVSNLSAAIAVPSALLSLRGSLGTPQKPQKPMGITPKRQSLR